MIHKSNVLLVENNKLQNGIPRLSCKQGRRYKKKGGGGGNLILNKLGVNTNKNRFQLALRCHTYCTVLDKYIIMLLLAPD